MVLFLFFFRIEGEAQNEDFLLEKMGFEHTRVNPLITRVNPFGCVTENGVYPIVPNG